MAVDCVGRKHKEQQFRHCIAGKNSYSDVVLRFGSEDCSLHMLRNLGNPEDIVRSSEFGRALYYTASTLLIDLSNLKSGDSKFLEENVYKCWKSCLSMLAKLEQHYRRDSAERGLFKKCRKALLDNIVSKMEFYQVPPADSTIGSNMFCNVTYLVHLVKLLSAEMAKDIFKSITKDKLGLYYKPLDDDNATEAQAKMLSAKSSKKRVVCGSSDANSKKLGTLIPICDYDTNVITWLEKLPEVLPDLDRRSLLLLYLAKSVRIEKNVALTVSTSFLCALLVEAVELQSLSFGTVNRHQLAAMEKEIKSLEKIVGASLHHVNSRVLRKCRSSTLLSIVKHYRMSQEAFQHNQLVVPIMAPKSLDDCLIGHLQRKSFTTQEVLLIYQQFPRLHQRGYDAPTIKLCSRDQQNNKLYSLSVSLKNNPQLQLHHWLTNRWSSAIAATVMIQRNANEACRAEKLRHVGSREESQPCMMDEKTS